jgi:hypothetical protein
MERENLLPWCEEKTSNCGDCKRESIDAGRRGGIFRSSEDSLWKKEGAKGRCYPVLIHRRKLNESSGGTEMKETKPFSITRQWVYDAYLKVLSNGGSGGVDGVSLSMFQKDYKKYLYRLWNQMSSGSYIPPPVRLKEIAKKGGGFCFKLKLSLSIHGVIKRDY